MFCRQCEQTENESGCSSIGVCGKTPQQAAVQELLVGECKMLAVYVDAAVKLGAKPNRRFTRPLMTDVFATLTNVNFDAQRLAGMVHNLGKLRAEARAELVKLGGEAAATKVEQECAQLLNVLNSVSRNASPSDMEAIAKASASISVAKAAAKLGPDVAGLTELAIYGLKGLCAYADHAATLGSIDDDVDKKIVGHFASLARDVQPTIETLVANALDIGTINLKVTQMLEDIHKKTFGSMEPTQVRASGVKGKAILVSGHDLHHLKAVLEATEGTGVNVYTHGELLPANAYPEMKKHKHLIGNYGTAWQNQKLEFAMFPGAILMTSNCIVQPMRSYKHRIFTTDAVGYEGIKHLTNLSDTAQMEQLIEAANTEGGFARDEPTRHLTIGYGKDTLLGAAGAVIKAIDGGALKNVIFIGGCDGSESKRNYFAELAAKVPDDALIMTAGCAKYRFNSVLEGQAPLGFPKVLDVGQCNDISGAIAVASALASHYKCSVNQLPLSFAVSWLEQKAVAQLLTCLALGIQGIKLGPALPAWISPAVLGVLVKNYNIAPVSTPAADFGARLHFQ